MTGLGVQILLPLVGIRSAFAQHEIMEILEIVQALGNAYRLASSGASLSCFCGRFALGFYRSVLTGMQFRIFGAALRLS
jgi:hypothetical protein